MEASFNENPNCEFVVDYITNRKYWFVRTNGGEYYDEYLRKGFIAVGFNWIIDASLIKQAEKDNASKRALYEKIKAEAAEDDGKQIKPGLVVNQIKRFLLEMNPGDIVLIPSENSQYIAFGEITSDTYIINESELQENCCPFIKRRRVKWGKKLSRDSLDPYLFKAIYSHHVITDVSDSSSFINRSLSGMYVSGDKAHITFRVSTQEAVRLSDIQPLLYGFEEVAIAAHFPANIISEIEATELKINVQSPGPIEYIVTTVGLIGFLAITIAINMFRATSAAKKNGGTLSLKILWLSYKCKINKPNNSSHDISTKDLDKLIEKIANNPEALSKLDKMANAINKLDAKLPNEKEDQ